MAKPRRGLSIMRAGRPAMLIVLVLAACARAPQPAERVVHEDRALAKAYGAWSAAYSKTADTTFSALNVRRFAPYAVTLEHGLWKVRSAASPGLHGRAPEADIRADDGVTSVHGVDR